MVGILLANLVLFSGCRERDEGPVPARSVPSSEVVAEPKALVMVGLIAGPQALWTDVRAGLGESGRRLPKHFPLLVTELLGVSPVLTGRFDLNEPARVALGVEGDRLQWALALRVQSGAELVAELTTGSQAAYRATSHDVLKELARVGADEVPARGVVSNWLIVATDSAALRSLGPYLGRKRIEDRLKAQTGELMLESAPSAGTKLADFWNAWWIRDGKLYQRELLSLLQGVAAEHMTDQLVALTSQVSTGVEHLLRGVRSSRVRLAIEETDLVVEGEQVTEHVWSTAAGTCAVIGQTPFAPTLAALAWGGQGALDIPLPDGPLQVRGPALLGVADSGQDMLGFADVGLMDTVPKTAGRIGAIFSEAARQSRKSAVPWTVSDGLHHGGRAWILAPSSKTGGSPPRKLQVALSDAGEAKGRSRWIVTTHSAGQLPQWGAERATLPWSRRCDEVVFGASLGSTPNRVALWGTQSDRAKGVLVLQGRAPLRSLLSF